MSPLFYNFLHVVGAFSLFIGLGSLLLPPAAGGGARKLGAIFHGVGLVLLLVAGFGMIAKYETGFPWWILVKMGLWLVFAVLPVLGKRGVLSAGVAWTVALVCGAAAAYIGLTWRVGFEFAG